jgi:enamine deaminase RidA (YjgF/YER057c/UK114 family)
VLSAAGASFDDVVKMTTYHVTGANIIPDDAAIAEPQQLTIPHLPLFIQVKDRYFTNKYPTWTGVGVTGLSTPGLIVEIKCTVVLDS